MSTSPGRTRGRACNQPNPPKERRSYRHAEKGWPSVSSAVVSFSSHHGLLKILFCLWIIQIRRYKASAAVMEKASDVYNKLKLRFVGKMDMAAKPKSEGKELEENEQGKNTG